MSARAPAERRAAAAAAAQLTAAVKCLYNHHGVCSGALCRGCVQSRFGNFTLAFLFPFRFIKKIETKAAGLHEHIEIADDEYFGPLGDKQDPVQLGNATRSLRYIQMAYFHRYVVMMRAKMIPRQIVTPQPSFAAILLPVVAVYLRLVDVNCFLSVGTASACTVGS
jgi:hypothetical protein